MKNVEKIHTRNSKTHFKGVVQKMLISSLVLTSILGSTTGAFASETNPKMDMSKVQTVAYENGTSLTTAINELKTTIFKVKMRVEVGMLKTSDLEKLASQIYQLEKSANGEATGPVVAILSEAEQAINGVEGAEQVRVALQTVRDSLGIGSLADSVQAPKANSGSGVVFSDVSESDWFYESVTAMSGSELLKGVGNGEFAPQAQMTRASYITIAVRIAYPNELNALNNENPNSANWWDNAWSVAHEKGLIKNADPNMSITAEDMNGTISREEMALILARTAHSKGIATSNLVYETQIPDFKEVAPYYRDSVRECYTLGMLNGTDQFGTFSPKGTLDRASASQSFYKLLNADKRTPVTPQAPNLSTNKPSGHQDTSIYQPASTLQTFKEGEKHTIAQAGDTVITKDGRTVVLTSTMIGGREFVGYGQGVDIVTGTVVNGREKQVGSTGYYELDKTPFVKSKLTGEVYTQSQWITMGLATYPSDKVGTEDGDIANVYWVWVSADNDWQFKGE